MYNTCKRFVTNFLFDLFNNFDFDPDPESDPELLLKADPDLGPELPESRIRIREKKFRVRHITFSTIWVNAESWT